MDQTIIFPILLFLTKRNIMRLLLNPNDKYFWKLLFIRDYSVNKIIGSYYDTYVLCNVNKFTNITNMSGCIYGLKRKTISNKIKNYDNLHTLTFLWSTISNISSEIGYCINLYKLYLMCDEIYNIPTEIGHCVKLYELKINHNLLRNIPSEIGYCVNLFLLDVSYNKLVSLPSDLGKCVNLRNLYACHNQIRRVPSEIAKYTFVII